jgi:hypothetical protein
MADDRFIAELRSRGVEIPAGHWKTVHFGTLSDHPDLWKIELVDDSHHPQTVRAEGTSLAMAVERLKIGMRHATMSWSERFAEQDRRLAADYQSRSESWKRRESCEMCNNGLHHLCTDTRSGVTNAAGCVCSIARPKSAHLHPRRG